MARHNIRRHRSNKYKFRLPAFDKSLFVLTVVFVLAGLVAVADASAPQAQTYFGDSFFYVRQQIVWAGVGIVAMLVTSFINYKYWERVSVFLFGASLLALILVALPGVGSKFLGARRWLSLGFFSFQPSELVKLSMVVYFASLASSKKSLKAFLLILGLVCGLIMLQPDLGTTIIVASIGLLQIFATGANLLHLAGAIGASAVLGLVMILSSDYRRARLMTYFGSTSDPQGSSYHISQILIALGSGGLFGVGLGQSRQKYLFLPEAATDSIFAIIAEEIGFIGSMFIILGFIFFVYRGITIAQRAPDTFSRLLAVGITCWIGIQAFLNISSMVALTPLTGVPMPFFSYGGTSLTMILVGVGILLNISRYGANSHKR